MTYDDWKTQSPYDNENECGFCGDPCSGSYCGDSCKRADIDDRKYE